MNKTPLPAQGPVDHGVRARAWLRRESITGRCSGIFETQDVELRSERLEPLYDQATLNAAIEAEREACAVAAWSAGMHEHNKALGMACCDAREVGSAAANAIRERSNMRKD